jgi:diguanylate cyclase (GGDEF)-like protein
VEVNEAFSVLTGVRKGDIPGRDCREVEPLNSLWNTVVASLLHKEKQSEQVQFEGKTLQASIVPVTAGGEIQNLCISFRDISSFVSLQNEFLKRNKELVITNTLSSAFISSSNMEHVYNDLLEKVLITSDLSMGWILVKEEGHFVLKSISGVSREFKKNIERHELDFLISDMANLHTPLFVIEPDSDEMPTVLQQEGISFFVAIPLRAGSEDVGVLMLASRMNIALDFDLASLLSLIGNNLSLIAEKIMLFQETERLAVTDALTGLYNTRHFYEILEAEVARTDRYETPFSLILFDIDDFKVLNDTYGHQAGDDVLCSVAEVFQRTSRKTDTVARYGGEEFISILPNTGKEMAYTLATRIKEEIERTRLLSDDSLHISVSGGVATCPFDATDARSLMYAADMAMYAAKAAGKNQIKCYAAREAGGKP